MSSRLEKLKKVFAESYGEGNPYTPRLVPGKPGMVVRLRGTKVLVTRIENHDTIPLQGKVEG